MSPWLKESIDIATASLTPIIAVVTALILVFQYRLAHQRWRLDLYDKRFVVYKATVELITSSMKMSHFAEVNIGKEVDDPMVKFTQDAGHFEFLFGHEVKDYLQTLIKKGMEHDDFILGYRHQPRSERMKEAWTQKKREYLEWFNEQHEVATNLFGKYLRIEIK